MLRDRICTTLLSPIQPATNLFFSVQAYGALEGSTGYSVTDEETGQEGFVQEFEYISGSMIKPQMPGLPGISKADAD